MPSRLPGLGFTALKTDHMVYLMTWLRSRAFRLMVLFPSERQMIENSGRRRPRGGHAGGHAQPVVGGPADREPRLYGDRRTDPGHPVEMPHVVLRQPAAPAAHPAVHRRPDDPEDLARLGRRQRDQFGVLALEQVLLADPAQLEAENDPIGRRSRAVRLPDGDE